MEQITNKSAIGDLPTTARSGNYMRPNGTFRQADLNRIFKAADAAGIELELELQNGILKIRRVTDKSKEQATETDDVVL